MLFSDALYTTVTKWVNGKDLGKDCHVLNPNGTMKLATDKAYREVSIDTPAVKKDTVIIIFQSYSDFKSRKQNIYVSQLLKHLRVDRKTDKKY